MIQPQQIDANFSMKYEIKVRLRAYPCPPVKVSFVPKESGWSDLVACLRENGAGSWEPSYTDLDVLDGSDIEVVARDRDLRVKTRCHNDAPAGFDEFWDLLEQVMEREGKEWEPDPKQK